MAGGMRLYLRLLLVLGACVREAAGQRLASMLGGHISWRLDDDFETSRNVTWTVRSAWHTSDFAYAGSGINIVLGLPIQLPAGSTVTYESKFGMLRVAAGSTVTTRPNAYVVDSLDGEQVEGQVSYTTHIPIGVYSANATLTLLDGSPLLRSQALVAGSVTVQQDANGGLPACNLFGPSPTPCELYTDGRANPNPLNLLSTLTLPLASDTVKWQHGKIINRHSPQPFPRPTIAVVHPTGAPQPEFQFPAFDLDGLPNVVHYPALSTRDGSGNVNVLCANNNTLTSYGCNLQGSALDLPPFVGSRYTFVTSNKVPSDFFDFYYSLTWKTTDGVNIVTSEFLINFCKSTITVGSTETLDRNPEWVSLDASGNIVRRLPPTTIECRQAGPCKLSVYAAKFSAATGTVTTPGDRPSIFVAGPLKGMTLQGQTVLANGAVRLDVVVGGLPNGTHTPTQIGEYKSACFYSKSLSRCRSVPICFKVKILGEPPFFLPPTPPMINPTDDVRYNETTLTPVCAGFTVSFTISAADPDVGEWVRLDVVDSTGDGEDIFSPPYNARKIGNFTGTTPVAVMAISYTLDNTNGVVVDPVTRRMSFAQDRAICSVAVDNTLQARYRFGGLPDGNFRTATKCHRIHFTGPPTFITTASRLDGTPFGALNGTLEERTRVVDAFIGAEKNITFRAQDPNLNDTISVLIMEDPGIPNGANTGVSTCEPQVIPVSYSPSGVFSRCSIASRTMRWTPPIDSDYSRNYKVCAVARDNSPQTICPSDRMTSEGWYGEIQCVEIRVVPPSIRYLEGSQVGIQNMTVLNAYVPCAMEYLILAADTAVGVNSSNVTVDAPYVVVIESVGELPERATLRQDLRGRVSRTALVYQARRGDEGREDMVCIHARDELSVVTTGVYCVYIRVRRCTYCLEEGDTMQGVMRETVMDFNWLRMWVANGNDDGDDETATVLNPDVMRASLGTEKQIINVGSLYTVQLGESLTELAARFQTTIKKLMMLNPDVTAELLKADQELCIIPCSDLPELPPPAAVVA